MISQVLLSVALAACNRAHAQVKTPPPKKAYVIGVSCQTIDSNGQREIGQHASTGSKTVRAGETVVAFEGGLVVIPSTDPALRYYRTRAEIWAFLRTCALNSQPSGIPPGAAGDSILGLLQSSMPPGQQLDRDSCKFQISAAFQVTPTRGTSHGALWNPNYSDPPASLLTTGQRSSRPQPDSPASVLLATFRENDLCCFAPEQKGGGDEIGLLFSRAIKAYRRTVQVAKAASLRAYSELYSTLAERRGLAELWRLADKPVGTNDLSRQTGDLVSQMAADRFKALGFTSPAASQLYAESEGAFTVVPLLNLGVRYWDSQNNCFVSAQYELPAPTFPKGTGGVGP